MKKHKKLKTFVIDRKVWLRGEEDSYLLRKRDGLMCCLGQIACRLGARHVEIAGYMAPDDLPRGDMKRLDWNPQAKTLGAMMDINDDAELSDDARERDLQKAAKRLGWRLRFTGAKKAAATVR